MKQFHEDIPTLNWDNAPVKTAHNAKADFIVPNNPVQAHALGRALAQFMGGEWTLVDVPREVKTPSGHTSARRLCIESIVTGERRHILAYKIEAKNNNRYIRTIDEKDDLRWATYDKGGFPRIGANMDDGQIHLMWSVVVERPVLDDDGNPTGERHAPELSRARYNHEFGRLIYRQSQHCITPNDSEFVNPLSLLPKDAILALLVAGMTIAIRSRKHRAIIEDFYMSEMGAILGIAYAERFLETEAA